MDNTHEKTLTTRRMFFHAFVLLFVFLLSFTAGILAGYHFLQPESDNNMSTVIEVAASVDAPLMGESDETDEIGNFILQHESVFADNTEYLFNRISSKEPIHDFVGDSQVSSPDSSDSKKRIILDKINLKTPLIAIVVDDMGINQKRTKDIISLQAPLTSSFLTYGSNLASLAAAARSAGHEIMIHAPMEPKVSANLAPDTLQVGMDENQITEIFNSMLAKFDEIKVKGINNHMGSKFTEDKEKLGCVMEILKNKGMFFLDSKTTALSKGKELALEDMVDYVARDVFLDNENNYDYIKRQLTKTEKIAAKKGFAIAICHPKSQTYLALKEWIAELKDKDLKLVHVSEIVQAVNK